MGFAPFDMVPSQSLLHPVAVPAQFPLWLGGTGGMDRVVRFHAADVAQHMVWLANGEVAQLTLAHSVS